MFFMSNQKLNIYSTQEILLFLTSHWVSVTNFVGCCDEYMYIYIIFWKINITQYKKCKSKSMSWFEYQFQFLKWNEKEIVV